jgi:hypothetical protein
MGISIQQQVQHKEFNWSLYAICSNLIGYFFVIKDEVVYQLSTLI